MGKFLKKNWFVCLIAIIFAGVSIFYIYDTNKGKLKGKKVNGESVVFSIDNQNITSSQFYDQLYKLNGNNAIASMIQKTVAEQSVETTDQMKEDAKTQAESIISNYKQQYPNDYKEQIGNVLIQAGYSGFDDLESYLISYLKLQTLTADYAKAHFDDLKIRSISYILVKFEAATHPIAEATASEKAKLDAIDKALSDGTDFATVAKDHSEDQSSAPNGGVLGVVDKNTSNLDENFLNAALALNEQEVSDWVYSPNFGYFKIRNNASSPTALEAFQAEHGGTETNPYKALVQSYDRTLTADALWSKAQELGIDFKGNADLEKNIKTFMGVKE